MHSKLISKMLARLCRGSLFALVGSVALNAQTSSSSPETPADVKSDKAVVLNPFEVTSSSNLGYGATSTSSAGRVVQDYVDVPQTVNVITSQFLQDFDIATSREALATVPGVTIGGAINNGTNQIRGTVTNSFYIDGLQGSAGDTEIAAGGAAGSMSMPVAFDDRIEVVKGPTSAAFGVGESGGIINYVLKSPQGINQTNVTLGVGTYNNWLATVDTQAVVNSKLSYRLVVDAERGDSSVWYQQSYTNAAQLALKYAPTDKTTVQMITSFEQFETPAFVSLPQYHDKTMAEADGVIYVPGFSYNPGAYPTSNGVPPTSLPYGYMAKNDPLSAPGWGTDVNQYFRSELNVVHKINENMTIRDAVAIDNTVQQQHITAGGASNLTPYGAPGSANPTPGLQPGQYGVPWVLIDWPIQSHGVRDSFDFTGEWDFLGAHLTTTAGGEVYKTWNLEDFRIGITQTASGGSYYYNSYNPATSGNFSEIINAVPNFFSIQGPWDSETNKGYGYYVQEQVSLLHDMITLLGAWRIDYSDSTDIAYGGTTSASTGWSNNKGAPRAAITFKPVKWLSIYSLYSKHSDPQKQTSQYIFESPDVPDFVLANPSFSYKPSGVLLEQGIKASLLDGRLMGSVAVYHDITEGALLAIEVPYVATTGKYAGINSSYAKNTITASNIHGVEATVTGIVNNDLMFTANYSLTRGTEPTTQTGSDAAGTYNNYVITKLTFPDVANAYAKYAPFGLKKDGIFGTFGYTYFSSFLAAQNVIDWAGKTWNFTHPSQYEVNAGIGYTFAHGRQSIILSSDNLTNQYIYLGASSQNSAVIQGRMFWLKYTVSL